MFDDFKLPVLLNTPPEYRHKDCDTGCDFCSKRICKELDEYFVFPDTGEVICEQCKATYQTPRE